ncbi:MAG: hypothetical protein IPJ76_16375 [Flavobacteriales bacterium]|nr:MAG: hypothetical protein IPJ76_16375 [Flavobacteriales bacterium]
MREKSFWLLAVGFWLLAGGAAAQEVFVPLHDGWSFQQVGKEQWFPTEVPGTVHDDLLRNGLIPDPMRNANIDSVQWVENEDWVYRRAFTLSDTLADKKNIDLVFKGLDTFADVYLNDSLLGKADNMFRQWEWPVKQLLRSGANELKVVFRSTINEGAKLRDAYGIQLPHDNDPSGVSPYVRKAAYQFGWDFAPRLVGCGIWREVGLRGWNKALLDNMLVMGPGSNGKLTIVPHYTRVSSMRGAEYWTWVDGRLVDRSTLKRAWKHLIETNIPEGAGLLATLEVRVELRTNRGVESVYTRRIPRSRHWERWGTEDAPFELTEYRRGRFLKGANVIPPRASSDSSWLDIVRVAQGSHSDMLRVWAGGVYPPDIFFDACDTAGILVWQDFMLANLVPDNELILLSTYIEALEQLRRISRHPSVALFCGNNELDVAWDNWGWQERYALHGADSAKVIGANRRLWREALSALVSGMAQSSYTPSSPLSNWGSAEGLKSGDLHYWGVWHGDSAFSSFRNNVGRFVSEYGFQSYPDSVTLAHYIGPEHLYLGSPMLAKRQKSYKTDKPIWTAIEREMGEKPTTLGRFIDCSQVMQAEAYRIAIWAHRTNQPHCMGTLYWQLNDVWAAPTWSTIDVDGRWKAAHYEVKRSYADRVLAFEPTATGGTALELWSDTELNGDSVVLELWTDAGLLLERQVHRLEGSGKKRLVEWPKDGFPQGVVAFAFGCGADARCHRAEVLKTMNAPKPELTLTPVPASPGEWEASCPVPVRLVEVVTGRGEQPSDNWFPLVPGHPKRFRMEPLDAVPQLSTFLR